MVRCIVPIRTEPVLSCWFSSGGWKTAVLPEWKEPIQQLDADVIVENGVVQATAKANEYYGLSLENSRVWTQQEGDITHLHVTTEAAGEAGKCLNLLRESPLGETLRAPAGDMTITGPVSAQFQLDAPLTTKPVLQGQSERQSAGAS